MRIAVCDDNRQDACALRALLDIFLEDSMSGLELARELRATDEAAVLCFVSTSEDFYREAYDLYAIQYLIKPVSREAIQRLLDKVEQIFIKNVEKTLPYSWRRSSGAIPYGKILYISSREHILSIHCTDGRIQESTGKLNDLEQQILFEGVDI